jgi:sugar/nucleoside kinase (ribokinase family)
LPVWITYSKYLPYPVVAANFLPNITPPPPGGPAAAAAIAVAALGHEAVLVARLGDDQVGRDVVRHLTGRGVDVSQVRLIAGQTSQVSSVAIDDERRTSDYQLFEQQIWILIRPGSLRP